jgi:hypothetical protein
MVQVNRFCHFKLGLPMTAQIVDSVECRHCGQRTDLPFKGYRVVLQSIATTKPVANAIIAAGGEDWFDQILPVNYSYPRSEVKGELARFPLAGPSRNGKNGSSPERLIVACPISGELCQPFDRLKRSSIDEVAAESQLTVESARNLKARIQ